MILCHLKADDMPLPISVQ